LCRFLDAGNEEALQAQLTGVQERQGTKLRSQDGALQRHDYPMREPQRGEPPPWEPQWGEFRRARDLSNADLSGADLRWADLTGANLGGANLQAAALVETDLTDADLTGSRIYGIAAWGLKLERAKQQNLVITPADEPEIAVDNIEVAQFVYLLLHNEKIRDVIVPEQ